MIIQYIIPLNCPRCLGEPKVQCQRDQQQTPLYDGYCYWVKCKCGAHGPTCANDVGAVDSWNHGDIWPRLPIEIKTEKEKV